MPNNLSRLGREKILIERRHQTQCPSSGIAAVFVCDHLMSSVGRTSVVQRLFYSKPEPGDIGAQIERRLPR